MNLSGIFKTEVYRPVVTIVIPGIVALAPFAYLFEEAYPHFVVFAKDFQSLAAIACLLAVIAAGFLLEDLGSLLESRVLDKFHSDKDQMLEDWYDYLRLAFETEPIGARYISSVVFRFKFELSFGIALLIAEVGCIILKFTTVPDFPISVLLVVPVICAYFIWESNSSSILLAKLRRELLKGCKNC